MLRGDGSLAFLTFVGKLILIAAKAGWHLLSQYIAFSHQGHITVSAGRCHLQNDDMITLRVGWKNFHFNFI